jgi:fatty-acyl-CoA synthase
VLNQAGVSTLVATPRFKTSDYAGMIAEVRPSCPALHEVLLIGQAEWASVAERGRTADPAPLAEIAATLTMDDPINIQYTSGTTG